MNGKNDLENGYNDLVNGYNDLVNGYTDLVNCYNDLVNDYNDLVNVSNVNGFNGLKKKIVRHGPFDIRGGGGVEFFQKKISLLWF